MKYGKRNKNNMMITTHDDAVLSFFPFCQKNNKRTHSFILIMLCKSLLAASSVLLAVRVTDGIPFATRAPQWLDNTTLLYEIAPKVFNIEVGAKVGNFASVKAKLPYLKELGVNLVWLAGSTLANNHYYNIWSAYGNVDPSKVDPSLGTDEELKSLIDAAHESGIRVLADWQTTGLANGTELAVRRPELLYEWKGYDNAIDHMQAFKWNSAEMTNWYVSTAVEMAKQFGFDGFRVDSGFSYIADLFNNVAAYNLTSAEKQANLNGSFSVWMEVARRLPEAVVMPELPQPDVFGEAEYGHMTQHDINPWTKPFPVKPNASLPRCHKTAQISSHDERAGLQGQRALMANVIFGPFIPVILGGDEFNTPYGPALPWAMKQSFPPYKNPMDCPNETINPGNNSHGGGNLPPTGECWPYSVPVQWAAWAPGMDGRLYQEELAQMVTVQKANINLLHKNICRSRIMEAPLTEGSSLPHGSVVAPYLRYSGTGEGILVMTNTRFNDTNGGKALATFHFNLTALMRVDSEFLEEIIQTADVNTSAEKADDKCFQITRLWPFPAGEPEMLCENAKADNFTVTIGLDRSPNGGAAAYRLRIV